MQRCDSQEFVECPLIDPNVCEGEEDGTYVGSPT